MMDIDTLLTILSNAGLGAFISITLINFIINNINKKIDKLIETSQENNKINLKMVDTLEKINNKLDHMDKQLTRNTMELDFLKRRDR